MSGHWSLGGVFRSCEEYPSGVPSGRCQWRDPRSGESLTYGGGLQLVRLGGVALTRERRKKLARRKIGEKISLRRQT